MGHRAEAVAELKSVRRSLETQIDLQTVVKSHEALAVVNSQQDDLSCNVQTHI